VLYILMLLLCECEPYGLDTLCLLSMGCIRSCARAVLKTTTISSISGNTAVTLDEKISLKSTRTSLPDMAIAEDGGFETSHTTCSLSAKIGPRASHGARYKGRVRFLGGQDSPRVTRAFGRTRIPSCSKIYITCDETCLGKKRSSTFVKGRKNSNNGEGSTPSCAEPSADIGKLWLWQAKVGVSIAGIMSIGRGRTNGAGVVSE
jgi:hypothetical protein